MPAWYDLWGTRLTSKDLHVLREEKLTPSEALRFFCAAENRLKLGQHSEYLSYCELTSFQTDRIGIASSASGRRGGRVHLKEERGGVNGKSMKNQEKHRNIPAIILSKNGANWTSIALARLG